MREATGELNITVIIVIFVALLVFFFSSIIWPAIKGDMSHDSKCSDAICEKCTSPQNDCKTVKCRMKNDPPTASGFNCPYKG